ncbi:hypothetical protein FHU35_11222 [Saccharopolyspora dendranthemae]|uniref:Uncharacterized protein n=2 Tax=Saccharopolyspora dendranthemae TaxID=1181886 RepID=A0A561V7L3_9PSEU|nr:hypothetical protein FHU35_11222 [Saccharopolyspora dendranthemae]
MILKEDNRQGGTELAVFYLDNRVINFDPFNVEVTAG